MYVHMSEVSRKVFGPPTNGAFSLGKIGYICIPELYERGDKKSSISNKVISLTHMVKLFRSLSLTRDSVLDEVWLCAKNSIDGHNTRASVERGRGSCKKRGT